MTPYIQDPQVDVTEKTKRVGDPSAIRLGACRLVQTIGAEPGRAVELVKPELLVGAADDCDFKIDAPGVSRQHFRIVREGTTIRAVDLNSTNGTWVDGVRVKEVFLRPGAIIRAGDAHFRFEPMFAEERMPPSERSAFGAVFGQSYRMREIFGVLEAVAPTEATVVLVGETGTGKTALARAIHDASPRQSGPFTVVDCGAITPTLVESELFGHERGAFTGALKQRAGAMVSASGGTLFIDEITELAAHLQPKLLRALEERVVTPVGSDHPVKFDCRVVVAAQRDLLKEVEAQRFRADLYYRLAVVSIELPPLRERREDIPLLVDHFLTLLQPGKPTTFSDLDRDLGRRLLAHEWPGNLRELRNTVERIAVMNGVSPFASARPRAAEASTSGAGAANLSVPVFLDQPFKEAKEAMLAAFEKAYVMRLLERTGGSVTEAARVADLDRKHIYNLMAKHKLGG